MGMMDSIKNRVSTNVKVTQLMFMTYPAQIVQFCQSLSPEERTGVMKGIESTFKWQPVAQIAQALFPPQQSSNATAEAADLAKGGFVSGAVDLMGMQGNTVQPQYGMTQAQQAALSYAWMVLKNMQQPLPFPPAEPPPPPYASPAAATDKDVLFCSHCGARRPDGANFCSRCGGRFA